MSANTLEGRTVQIPRLREWREARALTQAELAAQANISPRSVAGYEAGGGARPPTVRRLAAALGVDIADLVGEQAHPLDEAPPSQPTFNGLLEEEERRRPRRARHIEEAAKAFNASWAREVERNEFTKEDYKQAGEGLSALDNLLADTMFEPPVGGVSEEYQAIFDQTLREAARAVEKLRATLVRARAAHRDRTLEDRGVPQLHKYGAPQAARLLSTDDTRRSKAG